MTAKHQSLSELEQLDDFVGRHIGPADADIVHMLGTLSLKSLTELSDKVVPPSIRNASELDLPGARTEPDVLAELAMIAAKNVQKKSMIGMGYYGTFLPAVIQRNVLENPGWYTAYTPYQPEISQGRLEAVLNFQTMICELTGMNLSNASMLDEATAAAEAMTMCRRLGKNKSQVFVVGSDCHPQTIDVLRTRAEPMGIEVSVVQPNSLKDADGFGVLIQYPGSDGEVLDYRDAIQTAHERKTMVVMACDLLALTLLTSPGELGADIAVGSSQRFGVPMAYGGPHAAFMSTKDEFKRAIPGRIVGVSIDVKGRQAYRLALQTREQHIRREKATSNICTAQVLLAVIAGFYASYHGPEGLQTIARRVHRLTSILAAGLKAGGAAVSSQSFFDTITVNSGDQTIALIKSACDAGYNLRKASESSVGISLDETTGRSDIEAIWKVFGIADADIEKLDSNTVENLPESLLRTDDFLAQPVFNRYHSETEMLRYLRHLADKDIALDRAMIPLGSCTMKLNATTEMIPITWPGFSSLHPFAPLEQAAGYHQMTTSLEKMLCEVSGYDAVSLQPNAGSQGEYAGLLAIRAYHQSRGEMNRDICLIPSSAHGTNPASANMVGMKVIVVGCDKHGNVDVADLRAKAEKHSENLAALMVTYPSTHGVFEQAIREVCSIIHEHGGQVYLDGANLNALVGLAGPGEFGADVSHFNLHKTFCIPHGGGGPGVGPIGVGKHLAPFLPGHFMLNRAEDTRKGAPVSAAPWGSSGILPITWAYISLMGGQGLKKATECAILGANYLAARLGEHYPVLYSSPDGMVAHECIIDLRPIKEATGVTVDDVAKRLMDYGFHAPTMSFPVAGTLMIEPTESESLSELDRFCEAMIAIRHEIHEVEKSGAETDNPLRNAPHTPEDIAGEWAHSYDREKAVYPVKGLRNRKYWPPVGRVDNIYGDRNLICSCPPLSDYEQAPDSEVGA